MENETEVMKEIKIPEFPKNDVDLVRGSVIVALTDRTNYLGVKRGDGIPIGFDGEYIRCGSDLTWGIDDLIGEIKGGIWKIEGEVDLSDKEISQHFAKNVERLK